MIEAEKNQHATLSIFNGWNSWNNLLDACTKKIVQNGVRFLPSTAKQNIGEIYLTQTKLMVDGLGKVIWLQCTIGNPLLSPWLSGVLAVLGIIATAKPFCHYVKSHLQSISELPPQGHKERIVVAILSAMSPIVETIAIYYFGFGSLYPCISFYLWRIYIVVFGNVMVHVTDLQGKRSKDKLFADERNEVQIRAIECFIYLESEVKELKRKVRKFDLFVMSYPELQQVCKEHLSKHERIFPEREKPISYSDSSNIFQRISLLREKKYFWNGALTERKYFIEKWPKVRECFFKYLKLEQQREANDKEALVPYDRLDFFNLRQKTG